MAYNFVTEVRTTIILSVVLYGYETWSLTLREEPRLRMFENWVLRRIFGPKRDELTKEWRQLHNEKLNVLYCSPNIVRVIKWRRMRWAGHVACMGDRRSIYRILVGKPEERDHLGDPDVDGRIILRRIFRKYDVWVRTGSSWTWIGTCGGHL